MKTNEKNPLESSFFQEGYWERILPTFFAFKLFRDRKKAKNQQNVDISLAVVEILKYYGQGKPDILAAATLYLPKRSEVYIDLLDLVKAGVNPPVSDLLMGLIPKTEWRKVNARCDKNPAIRKRCSKFLYNHYLEYLREQSDEVILIFSAFALYNLLYLANVEKYPLLRNDSLFRGPKNQVMRFHKQFGKILDERTEIKCGIKDAYRYALAY